MTADRAPLKLRADNFTPPTRTPWGGTRIRERYKAGLGLAPGDAVVGESWEISVEPSFPSTVAGSDTTLSEVIAGAPEAWLGAAVVARHGGQTPLLIKLLDAAENLSVQVHPADGDPTLAEGESGKPEAWIILDAAPGASLYLGFRNGVDRAAVEGCIEAGGALDELLNRVPVAPGDAFIIEAGTPHAIGAGVTLIEPQIVSAGRRGITYRYWDWNRRYDDQGKLDAAGEPRQLHLQRSLAVTGWDGPRGDAFVATCRTRRSVLEPGPLERAVAIDWEHFVTEQWRGSGALSLAEQGTMVAVTCVGGRLRLQGATGALELACGESGVVPAAAGALTVEADEALAYAVRAR
ncbi:MAG: class I mannose-6-phosphate isomerase [Deltaproteobacteria bacterium]|nr:class I mannose-6-phosphate isomerase [Deltaproteobacteria bacterium]